MAEIKTPKELYNQAWQYLEDKNYEKLLDTSTTLLTLYPDSKEAKWALHNFPIEWTEREITINLKNNSRIGRALAFGIVVAVVLSILAIFIFIEPYRAKRGGSPESYLGIVFMLVYPISLFFGGVISGLIYRRKDKKRFIKTVPISTGRYCVVLFLIFLIISLVAITVIYMIPPLAWILSPLLGFLLGLRLTKQLKILS